LNSAVFSPDGSRVVTASDDNTARLWDATTGAALATLSGHTKPVKSAVFSSDGSRVVTASDDTTARLWDGKSGASLATLSGHIIAVHSAQFSPDGSRVVTASDGARLWDARTGAALATLSEHFVMNSAVFSPDGSRVVTASFDNTARLWDAKTGAGLAMLSGHTNALLSAEFSPDGSRVVTTASRDNTARIWLLDPIILMKPGARRDYVCRERLIGAQTFTDEDMQDPILRGRDDLRNPCDRVGPLRFEYYVRAAMSLWSNIRGAAPRPAGN
jgi:WD40 repeat protein